MFPASNQNLANDLDEDVLKKLGERVVEEYERDLESRSEWEDRNEEWLKLATQVKEEKTYPWPKAANIKYPLLTTAALQFQSRAVPALIPGGPIVKGYPIGRDLDGSSEEKAVRIGKHMSYQLLYQMDEWEEDMDKLCMILPLVGTAFKKSYFDSSKGRNVSELVLAKDLVVDYYARSLEEARRKTHVLYYMPNEIEEGMRSGFFKRVKLNPSEIGTMGEITEIQGIEPAGDDDDRPFEILEQHRWFDIDEDGYAEPVIVTVDKESREVLRVVNRFDEKHVTRGEIRVLDEDKVKTEYGIIKIEPIEYFTGYIFIPDPQSGVYGLGFGALLGPLNETVNTLINQLLDAGTLSNLQGGFIAKGTRLKGGDLRFRPGEWKQAQVTGDDLRKNIVPLPVQPPSAVLFNLLSTIVSSGEKVSSVMDIFTGELPGQNTPASVVMAAIEQGTKVFSAIYKRMHRAFTKEIRKLFYLNSKYLNDQEYFSPQDQSGRPILVMRGDYDTEFMDVMPTSDPNISSEAQRLSKAQSLLEIVQLGTVNPQVVTKRYLEATNQSNIDELMELPPPQPDPEIELKKTELQLEHQRESAKIQIEAQRVQNQATRDQANSLLAIKKAENLDIEEDLDRQRLQIEMLEKEAKQRNEMLKMLQENYRLKIEEKKASQKPR